MAAIEIEIRTVNNEQDENYRSVERVRARRSQLQRDIEQLKTELTNTESLIRDLQSQKENRVKAFGNAMPEILRAINAETRWQRRPVGPFGMHIKLKYMEWADIMESLIGSMLQSFLVQSHEDEKILRAILKRYNRYAKFSQDFFSFSSIKLILMISMTQLCRRLYYKVSYF